MGLTKYGSLLSPFLLSHFEMSSMFTKQVMCVCAELALGFVGPSAQIPSRAFISQSCEVKWLRSLTRNVLKCILSYLRHLLNKHQNLNLGNSLPQCRDGNWPRWLLRCAWRNHRISLSEGASRAT